MRAPALGIALAAAACAPLTPSDNSDARSLAAAESAFAAQSVREDMRAAFLAHFAADGVFVRGGWTRARPWLEPRAAPPITLEWRPVHVEAAASGELGLSTGPWKLTPRARPDAPAYGQFVSVWGREAGGAWKVLVDIGIAHPGPALWDDALEAMPARRVAAPSAGIEQVERAFADEAARRGLAAAYAVYASPRLRLYRPGAAPFLGKEAALAAVASPHDERGWVLEASGTSRERDFAFARGRHGEAPRGGWFLRVWRAEAGEWRIVLDVVDDAR